MMTKPLDKFRTASGIEYQRYADFRSALKPGWENSWNPNFVPPVEATPARILVGRMMSTITNLGISIKDVLEIGCGGGRCTFALAEVGAQVIDALDTTPSSRLDKLRNRTSKFFKETACEINFYNSDIIAWGEEKKYDLVVSWQVLEHITRWEEAIEKMYNLLKPGGLCYHVYEPFFSWRGGHAACTLDFPYGHVLLSSDDFARYIQQYRPEEYDQATTDYHTTLNRMTLVELHNCIERVGFEEITLAVKELEGQQWATQSMVEKCQINYPLLTVRDLVAHSVLVLLRKQN